MHVDIAASGTDILVYEVVTFSFRQMISQNLQFIGIVAIFFLFTNFLLNNIVFIISLNHVKVIPTSSNAVEVIRIRCVNRFPRLEVDFIATIRDVVHEGDRDDIAHPISIHRVELINVNVGLWNATHD